MSDNDKKKPTHVVMVCIFKNEYTWETKFCIPFYDEKSVVEYKDRLLENSSSYERAFVVRYY